MFFTFHISISIVLTTTFSTVFLYSFDVLTRTMLKSLFTAVCTFSCIHLFSVFIHSPNFKVTSTILHMCYIKFLAPISVLTYSGCMMFNFMCHLFWAKESFDSSKTLFLGMFVWYVFLGMSVDVPPENSV